MNPLARNVQIHKQMRNEGSFSPDQPKVEAAVRGRTARKLRAHLRRMEPVILTTPRWTQPQPFLEDLALELAVGEPALGCRTVSFRPLSGRPISEAWFFVLQVLAQLDEEGWSAGRIPIVGDRRAFRHAARLLLDRAQDRGVSVALLGHGAEHLPVELIEDLGEAWASFYDDNRSQSRTTLLLAGTVDASFVALPGACPVTLTDFGEQEAVGAISAETGALPQRELERAAKFTGGVPALVEALGRGSKALGGLPIGAPDLIRCMGGLADEIRAAVQLVSVNPTLAERLDELLRGEALVEVPELDKPLWLTGLLRRSRGSGEDRVTLRAPAIGAVLT